MTRRSGRRLALVRPRGKVPISSGLRLKGSTEAVLLSSSRPNLWSGFTKQLLGFGYRLERPPNQFPVALGLGVHPLKFQLDLLGKPFQVRSRHGGRLRPKPEGLTQVKFLGPTISNRGTTRPRIALERAWSHSFRANNFPRVDTAPPHAASTTSREVVLASIAVSRLLCRGSGWPTAPCTRLRPGRSRGDWRSFGRYFAGGRNGLSTHLRAAGSCSGSSSQTGQTYRSRPRPVRSGTSFIALPQAGHNFRTWCDTDIRFPPPPPA